MASNKSIPFSHAIVFVAVAVLALTASVQAQLPAPTPAPAPSQSLCPSGYPSLATLAQGIKTNALQGVVLLPVPFPPTPGTSVRKCLCYPSTNITILSFTGSINSPDFTGPYTCVPAPNVLWGMQACVPTFSMLAHTTRHKRAHACMYGQLFTPILYMYAK